MKESQSAEGYIKETYEVVEALEFEEIQRAKSVLSEHSGQKTNSQ